MKFMTLVLSAMFPVLAAPGGPYQDALKAAIKALSVSATEHDVYKNAGGLYVRRDVEVDFKVTESAHCELTIHRDSTATFARARNAIGPESPDPAKFYEIPLETMDKDLVRKNPKRSEQSMNTGQTTTNTSSQTYLTSEDTIVPLAGLDATGAKPNEVASTVPLHVPAYVDEAGAKAAIAALAALAAACH